MTHQVPDLVARGGGNGLCEITGRDRLGQNTRTPHCTTERE